MVTDDRPDSAAGYREDAAALAVQYESVGFEEVHAQVLHLVPERPGRVLDVGAGTGRDAAALAARGHRVLAVDPTVELRVHRGFPWLADSLPELPNTNGEFELILVTAVWMHLDRPERERGMRRIAQLLAPGGRVLMLLRSGPVPAGRRMFDVGPDETAALAAACGLAEVHRSERADAHGRAGVVWTHLALEAPK
ncbi:class I SAM-dependent methyltransferase [Kitasatospora sp. KL5]|uniref:class I SAM-dependent methyltransferase n=1 Tax=Kitasatospora sp. KL5 TaxID=3425125 RepID=UPI003D6E6E76